MAKSVGAQLLEARLRCDTIEASVKLCVSLGSNKDLVGHLESELSKAIREYNAKAQAFVKKMTLSNNVESLGEFCGANWHVVRHYGMDGEMTAWVGILKDSDIWMFRRDCKVEPDWEESQLKTLIISSIDEESRLRYMEVVKEESIKDLKAAGVELPETDTKQAVKVSHHAGCRWVQRTKGMSESQAVDYKRLNVQEVEKEVREGFESAEHIWTAEDGIEYWFDPNNMIYVYAPKEHNIITVYESDFSFAKHINRQIVLEQVQVIKKAWQEYKDAMDCHAEAVEQLDGAIGSVNDQIKVLESELELLKAKRDTLMAEKHESAKLISKASAAYEAECNKLFKYNKIIK